ncbi:MAG: hypothetical protein H0U76_17000 [Ktedonobacteraceae bacterium]|nr:hypothetical protein [Ktedonobacteraceae bacterium]
MQVQAPKGQFRVIGLDPIDTLTSPSGPFAKDCETLEEAVGLADRSGGVVLLDLRVRRQRRARVRSGFLPGTC